MSLLLENTLGKIVRTRLWENTRWQGYGNHVSYYRSKKPEMGHFMHSGVRVGWNAVNFGQCENCFCAKIFQRPPLHPPDIQIPVKMVGWDRINAKRFKINGRRRSRNRAKHLRQPTFHWEKYTKINTNLDFRFSQLDNPNTIDIFKRSNYYSVTLYVWKLSK